jgi:hypothetical protein
VTSHEIFGYGSDTNVTSYRVLKCYKVKVFQEKAIFVKSMFSQNVKNNNVSAVQNVIHLYEMAITNDPSQLCK